MMTLIGVSSTILQGSYTWFTFVCQVVIRVFNGTFMQIDGSPILQT